MKWILPLFVLSLFVLPDSGLSARADPCPRREAMFREINTPHLRDWSGLHRSFARFRHCDDGAMADGYSEFVTHTLAHRWDLLPQAEALFRGDPQFREFVIRHIDATTDSRDLEMVSANARRHCPVQSKALCSGIAHAAISAIESQPK